MVSKDELVKLAVLSNMQPEMYDFLHNINLESCKVTVVKGSKKVDLLQVHLNSRNDGDEKKLEYFHIMVYNPGTNAERWDISYGNNQKKYKDIIDHSINEDTLELCDDISKSLQRVTLNLNKFFKHSIRNVKSYNERKDLNPNSGGIDI